MIVCFGEVLLRLSSPVGSRMAQTPSLAVHCGGAEANVAAMLSQLGHEAEILTVLPRSPLGDLCEAELRRVGIDTRNVLRSEGRMGLYFFDQALGGSITYDREHSVFSEHADDFDWPAIAREARWFHLSGINCALGGKPARAALDAARAMQSAGVRVSFDVNHRASLWEGRPREDFSHVGELAALAQVLFASPRDIAGILDLDTAADPETVTRAAFDAFGQLELVAGTRRSHAAQGQSLSVRIDGRAESYETGEAVLGVVVDRIGAGDAFAAGVIDGLLRDAPLTEIARLGLAAAVMKHGIAGDHWIGTRAELSDFDPFVGREVRR